jgi:hypothetical protein
LYAKTTIIGVTSYFFSMPYFNLVPRACDPREGTGGSGIICFREESDWPLIWKAQFNLSQDSWLPATDYPRASRSFPRIAGSGNEIGLICTLHRNFSHVYKIIYAIMHRSQKHHSGSMFLVINLSTLTSSSGLNIPN